MKHKIQPDVGAETFRMNNDPRGVPQQSMGKIPRRFPVKQVKCKFQ